MLLKGDSHNMYYLKGHSLIKCYLKKHYIEGYPDAEKFKIIFILR